MKIGSVSFPKTNQNYFRFPALPACGRTYPKTARFPHCPHVPACGRMRPHRIFEPWYADSEAPSAILFGPMEFAENLWKVALYNLESIDGFYLTIFGSRFRATDIGIQNQVSCTTIWNSHNWEQEFCSHSKTVWLRVSVESCIEAPWNGGSIELLLWLLSQTVWKWHLDYYI